MTEYSVDSFIGCTLRDRYTVEEVIARGGMATVYRARDTKLNRNVAIKLFRVSATDDDELQRQQHEVQLLAQLSHPGLVTLFDAGVEGKGSEGSGVEGNGVESNGVDRESLPRGRGYLVMELIDGENLGDYLSGGPLQPQHVSAMGAELAEALFHIHRAGVIHRDVKPANILIVPTDIPGAAPHIKLTDFGIALIADVPRATGEGAVIGTASYLSPEQALGQTLTHATDVYSLGLVLLECLTGARAFLGTPLESARARILRPPAIPQTLPHGWAPLLRSMTQRDPENRPNAMDVAKSCRRILHRSAAALAETTQMLDLTKVLQTNVIAPPASPSTDAVPVSAPAPALAPVAVRRRRTTAWTWFIAAVIAASAGAVSIAGAPESDPVPSYPHVSGTLGTHLRDLQESVDP